MMLQLYKIKPAELKEYKSIRYQSESALNASISSKDKNTN